VTEITNTFVDDEDRQCRGKVAFSNKGRAKRVARRHGAHRKLRAYRCAHCGLFHLGRRP